MSLAESPREACGGFDGAFWVFYKEARFVDCTVVAGAGSWECHKAVLAASCSFFDLALEGASACASTPHTLTLPFPEEACMAFDDVLPYLYTPEREADVKLQSTVPMLVLSALLGMNSLAQRLHDAMLAMAAVPLQCAAVMSLLVNPWLRSLEVNLGAMAVDSGLPHDALAVASAGARFATKLCDSLHDWCTAALQPMLPSLDVDQLDPEIMLSLLRHPSAQSHASDMASKYIMQRDTSSIPDATFSQLAGHVQEVSSGDVPGMLQLAIRRKEASLISRCLSAASERGGSDSAELDSVLLSLMGGDKVATPILNNPHETPESSRKRKSTDCLSDPPRRSPNTRSPLTSSTSPSVGVLLSQIHPQKDAEEGDPLFGSLHDTATARWGDDNDDEEETAMEALVTQSQGDGSGMQAALERLGTILTSHRARRKALCRDAVADTRSAMQVKGELLADRCRVLWTGVEEHAVMMSEHVSQEVERLRSDAREKLASVAQMRSMCDAMEAEVGVLLQRGDDMQELAAKATAHNKAQIRSAGDCSQRLVSVLKADYDSSAKVLEQRLTHATDRNGGALLKLSSLLAKELSME